MALRMQDGGAPPAPEALQSEGEEVVVVDDVKKGKKLPIIIAAVVLFLVFGGIALKVAGAKHHHKMAPKVGETLPLDEFMLNLADPSNDHYAKITVALGLKEGVSSEKFKEKVPQARDAIVMVLTSKHLAEIRSSDGKMELKREIKQQVNKSVGEDDVVDVYFEAFATQ